MTGAWGVAEFVLLSKDAVLAIVLGGNLVVCLCVWWWARPRSGLVKAVPVVALLTVAMLLGILPKVFWPAADGMHIAGTIASLIVSAGVSFVELRRIVIEIRRRRRLSRGAMPV